MGTIFAFLFLTLSIASGLYYLSELVEEHSAFAKRVLQRMIYTVLGLHILILIFDKQPFFLTLFSCFAHVIYSQNLRSFPFIQLSSPVFISSCILVLLDHWFWFRHFSNPPRRAYEYDYRSSHSYADDYPTFGEIASFFGICVWLVPFSLFVSLSAGENVLPSTSDSSRSHRKGPGLAKQFFDGTIEWFRNTGELLGIMGPESRYIA